ncbi:hypothetical protein SAY86_015432 [Trapa natans]|uniref:TCP domain-containing protein n=1 Tax=Trapa natans TaxID=22666 RepID=A0AAN7KJW7_TRANT|nr:hypothetical protein SAY86_015432 [Trapa natans]
MAGFSKLEDHSSHGYMHSSSCASLSPLLDCLAPTPTYPRAPAIEPQEGYKGSMNASSREIGGFSVEEESDQGRLSLLRSSSRRRSAFRNPRIVRGSHSLGSKDRHSKVCTVQGLRDRRIRLSVPTAEQLYSLQDKLGVSQPSKVIDWLIEATKNEIDKLPPLQMPLGLGEYIPLIPSEIRGGSCNIDMSNSTSTLLKHGMIDPLLHGKHTIGIKGNSGIEYATYRSQHWEYASDHLMRAKGKEIESREYYHLERANKVVEPVVPSMMDFLPHPNLSSYDLSCDSIASLSLASNTHYSPYFSLTPPTMPHSFPPHDDNATPHPLEVDSSLQLFSSGQSFMPQSLHLFRPSTLRPTVGECLQFSPDNLMLDTHQTCDDQV